MMLPSQPPKLEDILTGSIAEGTVDSVTKTINSTTKAAVVRVRDWSPRKIIVVKL